MKKRKGNEEFLSAAMQPSKQFRQTTNVSNQNLNQPKICQEIYKTLRNYKDTDGRVISDGFVRTPSRRTSPEYHIIISNPIDFVRIQQKIKTDKYDTVDEFGADLRLLIENAKCFYKVNSQEYSDARKLSSIYHETVSKYLNLGLKLKSEANEHSSETATASLTGEIKDKAENTRSANRSRREISSPELTRIGEYDSVDLKLLDGFALYQPTMASAHHGHNYLHNLKEYFHEDLECVNVSLVPDQLDKLTEDVEQPQASVSLLPSTQLKTWVCKWMTFNRELGVYAFGRAKGKMRNCNRQFDTPDLLYDHISSVHSGTGHFTTGRTIGNKNKDLLICLWSTCAKHKLAHFLSLRNLNLHIKQNHLQAVEVFHLPPILSKRGRPPSSQLSRASIFSHVGQFKQQTKPKIGSIQATTKIMTIKPLIFVVQAPSQETLSSTSVDTLRNAGCVRTSFLQGEFLTSDASLQQSNDPIAEARRAMLIKKRLKWETEMRDMEFANRLIEADIAIQIAKKERYEVEAKNIEIDLLKNMNRSTDFSPNLNRPSLVSALHNFVSID